MIILEKKYGYTFEKEGMQALSEALENEDARIRHMAATFLGETEDVGIVNILISAFSDPEKTVRARAVDGLVRIGSPSVKALLQVCDNPDWVVRYRALEALGRIGDRAALETMIDHLGDEKDHVRYMAAKGLGHLKDSSAIEALGPVIRDGNPYVGRMAVDALGAIGGAGACEVLAGAMDADISSGLLEKIQAVLDQVCPDS